MLCLPLRFRVLEPGLCALLVLNAGRSSGHLFGEWCFSLRCGHPSSVPCGLPSRLPRQHLPWSVCDVRGVGCAIFRACYTRPHAMLGSPHPPLSPLGKPLVTRSC